MIFYKYNFQKKNNKSMNFFPPNSSLLFFALQDNQVKIKKASLKLASLEEKKKKNQSFEFEGCSFRPKKQGLLKNLNILRNAIEGEKCFWNQTFDKSRLKNFVLWFLANHGEHKTIKLVEVLKNIGFQYATKAGISLGIEDLRIPEKKYSLMMEAEQLSVATIKQYKRGEITGVERFQRLIDTWHRTSERLKQEVIDNFEATDILNPVYMMAFSGARGNISQVRQLVGMRGLMSNPQGQIIDFPIRSNFREGLTLTEYIISSYGARKGIVDTALRTANAGYLTRRLVDVAQHVIISNFDCGTKRGIFLTDMKEGNKTIYSLQNRLIGRVLARDIYNKEKKKIASRNIEISADLANTIASISKKVFVRSALTCQTKKLVCQLCYGWSLAQGNLVSIGEAVGVVAAQSIGEPGTQLTMRTFHTGGVFSGDVSDQIRAPFDGIVEYTNPIAGTLIRTPEGKIAFLTKNEGSFMVHSFAKQTEFIFQNDISSFKTNLKQEESSEFRNTEFFAKLKSKDNIKETKKFKIPFYTLLFLRNGEKVVEKEVIAQISSINRQKNATDQAELTIKSELSGQFYSKILDLKENKVGPKLKNPERANSSLYLTNGNATPLNENAVDTIFEAWGWGYTWVLSGKVYQLALPSSFFPILGDYVNKKTYMNQIKWNVASSFGTSFKLNMPLNQRTLNKKRIKPMRKASINSIFLAPQKTQDPKKTQLVLDKKQLTFLKKELISFQLSKIVYKKIGYFLKLTNNQSNSVNLPTSKISLQSSSILSANDTLFLFSSIFSKNISYAEKSSSVGSKKAELKNSIYPQNWKPSFDVFLNWFPKRLSTKSGGLIFMEPVFFGQTFPSSKQILLDSFNNQSARKTNFLNSKVIGSSYLKETVLQSNKSNLKKEKQLLQNNSAYLANSNSALRTFRHPSLFSSNFVPSPQFILSTNLEDKYKKSAVHQSEFNWHKEDSGRKDYKQEWILLNFRRGVKTIKNSNLNKKAQPPSGISINNAKQTEFAWQGVNEKVAISSVNKKRAKYQQRFSNKVNIFGESKQSIKNTVSYAFKIETQYLKAQLTYNKTAKQSDFRLDELKRKQKLGTVINNQSVSFFPTFIRRERITKKLKDNISITRNNITLSSGLNQNPLSNQSSSLSSEVKLNNLNNSNRSLKNSDSIFLKEMDQNQFEAKREQELLGLSSKHGLLDKQETPIVVENTADLAKNLFFEQYQQKQFGTVLYTGLSVNKNKTKTELLTFGLTWKNTFKLNSKALTANAAFIGVKQKTNISPINKRSPSVAFKEKLVNSIPHERVFWVSQPFYSFSLKKIQRSCFIFSGAKKATKQNLFAWRSFKEPILLQINRQGKVKSLYSDEGHIQTNTAKTLAAELSSKTLSNKSSQAANKKSCLARSLSLKGLMKKTISINQTNKANIASLGRQSLLFYGQPVEDKWWNCKKNFNISPTGFAKQNQVLKNPGSNEFDKQTEFALKSKGNLMWKFQKDGLYSFRSFNANLSKKLQNRKKALLSFLPVLSKYCFSIDFSFSHKSKKEQEKINSSNFVRKKVEIKPVLAENMSSTESAGKFLNLKTFSKITSFPYFLNKKSISFLKLMLKSRFDNEHSSKKLTSMGKVSKLKNVNKKENFNTINDKNSLANFSNNINKVNIISHFVSIGSLEKQKKQLGKLKKSKKGSFSALKRVKGFVSFFSSAEKEAKKASLFNFYFYSLFNKKYRVKLKSLNSYINQKSQGGLNFDTAKKLTSSNIKEKLLNKSHLKNYKESVNNKRVLSELNRKKRSYKNSIGVANTFLNLVDQKHYKLKDICSPYLKDQLSYGHFALSNCASEKKNQNKTLNFKNQTNTLMLFDFSQTRYKLNLFYHKGGYFTVLNDNSLYFGAVQKQENVGVNKFVPEIQKQHELSLYFFKSLFSSLERKRKLQDWFKKFNRFTSLKQKNVLLSVSAGLKMKRSVEKKQTLHKINSKNNTLTKDKIKTQSSLIAVNQKLNLRQPHSTNLTKHKKDLFFKKRKPLPQLNMMIKPGWLYYTTNLSSLFLYNKKLMHPGKKIGNDFIFDRHSVYLDIVSLDKLALCDLKKDFWLKSNQIETSILCDHSKNQKLRFSVTNFAFAHKEKTEKSEKKNVLEQEKPAITIKNNKCRFKLFDGEQFVQASCNKNLLDKTSSSVALKNKSQLFFVLIRKACEYKLFKDTEYKKEISKIARQKTNSTSLSNLNKLVNLDKLIQSHFFFSSAKKQKINLNSNFSRLGGSEENIKKQPEIIQLKNKPNSIFINKAYHSINLYTQYKTGLLNKQRITPQTISKYPASELKIISSAEQYYSSLKEAVNKSYFNSISLSCASVIEPDQQKLFFNELRKQTNYLKINKISSWGLPCLPITSIKAINFSPLIVSYKAPYAVDFPFKTSIRLFSEQSKHGVLLNRAIKSAKVNVLDNSEETKKDMNFVKVSFLGQSSINIKSENKDFVGAVSAKPTLLAWRKKTKIEKEQPYCDLKRILYTYLLKMNSQIAFTHKEFNSISSTSSQLLSYKNKNNFNIECFKVSYTLSVLSSIFSCPIVEYSLGKDLEKSISCPNNVSGSFNTLFESTWNNVNNKKSLSTKNRPVLGSITGGLDYNNKYSINKEISLYKTEFVSFINNDVNIQLPFIKTYTYCSFEGELIYKSSKTLFKLVTENNDYSIHNNIFTNAKQTDFAWQGENKSSTLHKGKSNRSITQNTKQSLLSQQKAKEQITKTKRINAPEGLSNSKKIKFRLNSSQLLPQSDINSNAIISQKGVGERVKSKQKKEQTLDNNCMILTKKDQIAFYFPIYNYKESLFALENLKKKNQYIINDIIINFLNQATFENENNSTNQTKLGSQSHEENKSDILTINTNFNKDSESSANNDNEFIYKINKLPAGMSQQISKLLIGDFLVFGDQISPNVAISKTGQIIHINTKKITLRLGQPIFVSPKAILHKYDGDFIDENSSVITLSYQQLKTGDIIQGIPKVEQFFEARTTKRGRLFRDSLSNLLKGLFKRYRSKLPLDQAVRQSFYKIQQIIVDGVQRVYRSQGVTIADKHLEVIVKQMTSKVRIIEGGQTGFFPGEIVDLDFVEQVNNLLMKKIIYEPLVLGITKASLEVDSFLSAASFQQTTRVLSKAAISRKKDFLKGLKENVILGNLIPAGTGYLVYLDHF